jgi:hypothetical protein
MAVGFVRKDSDFPRHGQKLARRTGATLMYLAGMDIFDIMKVTGHTTPEMLKRYIKADQLDVVQKLTDKYDYFD